MHDVERIERNIILNIHSITDSMKSENIRDTIMHPWQFSTFDEPAVPNPRAEAKPRENEEAVAIIQFSICERANKRWSGDTSTRRVYMCCLHKGTWWEQKSYAVSEHCSTYPKAKKAFSPDKGYSRPTLSDVQDDDMEDTVKMIELDSETEILKPLKLNSNVGSSTSDSSNSNQETREFNSNRN